VLDAFWRLDALPADVVKRAFASWGAPLAEVDGLDRIDAATRARLGLPPRALRLRTLSSA
jgi:hypothetical protein